LATLDPEKLQGFHGTPLYHCYTLLTGCGIIRVKVLRQEMCRESVSRIVRRVEVFLSESSRFSGSNSGSNNRHGVDVPGQSDSHSKLKYNFIDRLLVSKLSKSISIEIEIRGLGPLPCCLFFPSPTLVCPLFSGLGRICLCTSSILTSPTESPQTPSSRANINPHDTSPHPSLGWSSSLGCLKI